MLGSFVATVLGIVVTFGVSKTVEIKNVKDMQRQSAYNVITDLDNIIASINQDEEKCQWLNSWLPDNVMRYARGQEVDADSVYNNFMGSLSAPMYMTYRTRPVGRDIINNIVPANEHDMELHRMISLAYEDIDRALAVQDTLYNFFDQIVKINVRINTSRTDYTHEDCMKIYMESDPVRQLAYAISVDADEHAMNKLANVCKKHKERILRFAGITKEEYDAFMQEVDDMLEEAE